MNYYNNRNNNNQRNFKTTNNWKSNGKKSYGKKKNNGMKYSEVMKHNIVQCFLKGDDVFIESDNRFNEEGQFFLLLKGLAIASLMRQNDCDNVIKEEERKKKYIQMCRNGFSNLDAKGYELNDKADEAYQLLEELVRERDYWCPVTEKDHKNKNHPKYNKMYDGGVVKVILFDVFYNVVCFGGNDELDAGVLKAVKRVAKLFFRIGHSPNIINSWDETVIDSLMSKEVFSKNREPMPYTFRLKLVETVLEGLYDDISLYNEDMFVKCMKEMNNTLKNRIDTSDPLESDSKSIAKEKYNFMGMKSFFRALMRKPETRSLFYDHLLRSAVYQSKGSILKIYYGNLFAVTSDLDVDIDFKKDMYNHVLKEIISLNAKIYNDDNRDYLYYEKFMNYYLKCVYYYCFLSTHEKHYHFNAYFILDSAANIIKQSDIDSVTSIYEDSKSNKQNTSIKGTFFPLLVKSCLSAFLSADNVVSALQFIEYGMDYMKHDEKILELLGSRYIWITFSRSKLETIFDQFDYGKDFFISIGCNDIKLDVNDSISNALSIMKSLDNICSLSVLNFEKNFDSIIENSHNDTDVSKINIKRLKQKLISNDESHCAAISQFSQKLNHTSIKSDPVKLKIPLSSKPVIRKSSTGKPPIRRVTRVATKSEPTKKNMSLNHSKSRTRNRTIRKIISFGKVDNRSMCIYGNDCPGNKSKECFENHYKVEKQRQCRFGNSCRNANCYFQHPKTSCYRNEIDCYNCSKSGCSKIHGPRRCSTHYSKR